MVLPKTEFEHLERRPLFIKDRVFSILVACSSPINTVNVLIRILAVFM